MPRIPQRARPAASSVMRQILERLLADLAAAVSWLLFLASPRLLFRQPPRTRGGRSFLAPVVRERCQRIFRHEAAQLVVEFMAEHGAAINFVATAPTFSIVRSRRRAVTLARVRAMGRSMAALNAQPLAPESAATKAALRGLHLTVDGRVPSWLDAFILSTSVSVPFPHVTTTFCSASRLSSAGPASQSFEHFHDLFLKGNGLASSESYAPSLH